MRCGHIFLCPFSDLKFWIIINNLYHYLLTAMFCWTSLAILLPKAISYFKTFTKIAFARQYHYLLAGLVPPWDSRNL